MVKLQINHIPNGIINSIAASLSKLAKWKIFLERQLHTLHMSASTITEYPSNYIESNYIESNYFNIYLMHVDTIYISELTNLYNHY